MAGIIMVLAGATWLAVGAYAVMLAASARRADALARDAFAACNASAARAPLTDEAAALITALERHDGATGWHSRRVSLLSRRVGALLGVDGPALDDLEEAALVHDAGKLRVPARILCKAGALTPGEWALVRRHPDWGAELVSNVDGLSRHASTVRAHHECWAGGGYPAGSAGAGIPLPARIIAACDAYDAMTSKRPHAPRRSPAAAIKELQACSGRQFDPLVVAALQAALAPDEELVALAG